MRSTLITGAALVLALLGAQQAAAQAPQLQFELTPAIGGALFAADMPTTFQLQNTAGGNLTLSNVVLEDAVTFGGRTALRFADRVSIGAGLFYTPLAYSTTNASDLDGGLYTYGADVAYHATGLSRKVAPFAVIGLGAKTYDFEGAELETDFMWNAGGGLDVRLNPALALRLEARDYMSMFDPQTTGIDEELQHDVVLSAGLSFTFGPRQMGNAAAQRPAHVH